ncbi:MAG TPA: symmetrical bis(5'-nucleosyl)-tetraphosphatase [Stenotrophobium sp.]|nr:symmetrical bis(5'-nucleosyl)-tetraphosphatase [Stenotrophobium sp.]
MTTYAIGDIQGCDDALQALLRKLDFQPGRDRLLLTGDLVNRGPDSLKVLRRVKSLGASAITVLGNHDLHLLAVAHGSAQRAGDTLQEVLDAPDRDELLDWLRQQPLAHHDAATGVLLVHAGLPPQWTTEQALQLAAEASTQIGGSQAEDFFERMYGNQPDIWDERLHGIERLRFIVNCFTRLRYCDAQGRMHMKPKGAPGTQPRGLMPWFEVPGRKSADTEIIFGHWSTLGQVHWPQAQAHGLDTGCVWGGCLTALNLDTGKIVSSDCAQYRRPGMHGD